MERTPNINEVELVDIEVSNNSLAVILGGVDATQNVMIAQIMESVIQNPENTNETSTIAGILNTTALDKYGFQYITLFKGLIGLSTETLQQSLTSDDGSSTLCYIYDVEEDIFSLVVVVIVDADRTFGVLKAGMKEMLKLQHKLNIGTNGPRYLYTDVNEKNGKHINFSLDIKMELAELINTYPYKHWKDQIFTLSDKTINHQNILVEHTDIWHFLMSFMLQASATTFQGIEVDEDALIDNLANGNIPVLYPDRHYIMLFNFIAQLAVTKDEDLPNLLYSITSKWMESQSNVVSDYQNFLMVSLLLERMYGFDFAELIDTYLGKNALNQFRLDNGYKEGTYTKIWDNIDLQETDDYISKEDNDFMIEIVKDLNNTNELSFENIYKRLDVKYKEVIESMVPRAVKEETK